MSFFIGIKYFNFKKWVSILTFTTLLFTIVSAIFSFYFKYCYFSYYNIPASFITLDYVTFLSYGTISFLTALPIVILVYLSICAFKKFTFVKFHYNNFLKDLCTNIIIFFVRMVTLIPAGVIIDIVAFFLASLYYHNINIRLFNADYFIVLTIAFFLITPIVLVPKKISYYSYSIVLFIIILCFIINGAVKLKTTDENSFNKITIGQQNCIEFCVYQNCYFTHPCTIKEVNKKTIIFIDRTRYELVPIQNTIVTSKKYDSVILDK